MTELDLKRGDVLLITTDSPLAALCRMLDGARHDRAVLILGAGDGREAVYAHQSGIVATDLPNALIGAEQVEVYRFRSDDGRLLDDPALPLKPLLDKARYFLDKNDRFAHDDLVQLALIASTRRPPIHGWLAGLSTAFEQIIGPAIHSLDAMLLNGRSPATTASFVHRCFAEAGLKYRLRLPASRSMTAQSPAALARAAFQRAGTGTAAQSAPTEIDADLLQLHARLQSFFARYYAASLTDLGTVTGDAQELLAPEIVTARDLADSPNLVRVGAIGIAR